MKRFLLAMILLVGTGATYPPQQQSALAILAASMQPGTWAELPTNGMVAAFTGTGGSTGIINPYGMTMVRDTIGKCSYYMGSDHGGNYTPGPLATYRFVRYCELTNEWTVLPTPPWAVISSTTYTDAHGYHLTAINVVGRKIYRMPYNSAVVNVYNIDAGVWSVLPANPQEGPQVINSIEFFPARNALIHVSSSGSVWEFREATQTHHNITPQGMNAGLVSTWNWVNCHPVLNECFLGSSTGKHWKYNATGVMTQLNDIPAEYRTYDGSGINGLWVTEPSGKLLLMTDPTNGTGRNVYEFDPSTQVYTAAPPPPDKHINNSTNWNAVSIQELGVTMWVWAQGSGDPVNRAAGVFVYKHVVLPPDITAPSVSITSPANASSVTGTIAITATASDDREIAGVTFKDDGVNIGTEDKTAPFTATWTVPAAGSHTLTAVARDQSGNTTTSSPVTVTGTVLPPPTGVVGGYPMPSLGDEKATYGRFGWSFTASQDPANLTEPVANYTVTNPDIHYGTEGDDLWTYLFQNRRTGNVVYWNRANAWARYFKEDYRTCVGTSTQTYCADKTGYGLDHFYGWGLLALYEHNGDSAALFEAKNLATELAVMYSPATSFGCLVNGACLYYGTRQVGRHLLFATRIAEITKDPAHVALRDKIIEELLSPEGDAYWNATYGMYFVGQAGTDAQLGAGAYAAGARLNSPFGIAVLAEAMFHAYRTTGNVILRHRLIAMARFVQSRGLDATYQYTGSLYGVVNGQTYHNYSYTPPVTFWDPVYTTSQVNLLVMGYKYTGDVTLLAKAKEFLNRGTKGVYGSPTARSAADNAVGHFIDTKFDTSSGNFYLDFNKGELLYTYLIFENGGLPTVEGTAPPPVNTAPAVLPIPNVTTQIPSGGSTASAVLTAVVTDDGLPKGTVTNLWTGAGVNFGNPTEVATNATAPAGTHTITFTANDGALSTSRTMIFTVNPADFVNQPPTVTIQKPTPGQVITTKTFTLSVTTTDDIGVSWLELYVNNQLVKSAMTTTMTYSLNTQPYKGRSIAIKAIAKDADGLTATATVNASVRK